MSEEDRVCLDDFSIIPHGVEVEKTGGDYYFRGTVLVAFYKIPREGKPPPIRVVVQNEDGILHIFSPKQLFLVQ